jgi:hypothetical protein
MRTVSIPVYNEQKLELFIEKLKDGFEFWAVGIIKGERVVIDHHLTHDDLQARLEYAQPEDLIWRDATRSEIPVEKHNKAILQEETIERGVFWDYENAHKGAQQSVASHLGAISFLTKDRKELIAAKKMILGRWTDGVLTFSTEPNNKLQWSCADRNHPLNVVERTSGHRMDWWNFASWKFAVMNEKHKAATYVSVLRVNEQELHLTGGGHLHRMAQIFRRKQVS